MMSQINSALHGSLQQPTTPDAKAEIVLRLWRTHLPNSLEFRELDWAAYFSHYSRECDAALVDQGKRISARTHNDLLRVAHLLEDGQSEDELQDLLRQDLTQQRTSAEAERMLYGSIRLASRVLLMLSIGPLPSEAGPLRQAVHNHFDKTPAPAADSNYGVIEMDLTCRNIERLTGIEIVPTDNLVDHLRFLEKSKKLYLFHHTAFLDRMKIVKRYSALDRQA
jgi:hypothetical protein